MINVRPTCIVMAPYPTRSGYGDHSRDLIKCLINMDKYELFLVPMNWGNCSMNALKETDPIHKKMIDLSLPENIPQSPDIFIHVSVPTEFRPVAKCNIGITAGIETDRVSAEWLDKGNSMTAIIVPSKHSKSVQENSIYDLKQGEGGPVVKQLKNEKPIEVLFEGVDTEIYKPLKDGFETPDELKKLDDIEEDFCFLSVGHWLQGDYRHDRKDIGGLIYNFLNTFNYEKGKVALVLKTSGATTSLLNRKDIERKIQDIRDSLPDKKLQPRIYLVHGNLTDEEMNALYNHKKIKAMVSTTHGEGYGRPLAEFAAATGKPVYATNWSGHTDFLDIGGEDFLFKYELKPIDKSAVWSKLLVEGAKWAYVDDADVSSKLKRCYHNYDSLLSKSKIVQTHILKQKTLKHMQKAFEEILEKYTSAIIPQNIVLPKNINIPKLEKLKGK